MSGPLLESIMTVKQRVAEDRRRAGKRFLVMFGIGVVWGAIAGVIYLMWGHFVG